MYENTPPPGWKEDIDRIDRGILDVVQATSLSKQHAMLTVVGREIMRVAESIGTNDPALMEVSTKLVSFTISDLEQYVYRYTEDLKIGLIEPEAFVEVMVDVMTSLNTLKLLPMDIGEAHRLQTSIAQVREFCNYIYIPDQRLTSVLPLQTTRSQWGGGRSSYTTSSEKASNSNTKVTIITIAIIVGIIIIINLV